MRASILRRYEAEQNAMIKNSMPRTAAASNAEKAAPAERQPKSLTYRLSEL
jgi:hypothetical protein